MKKIILTLAFVTFAMAANAQWILGGQVSFYTTGGNLHQEAVFPVTTPYDVPNLKTRDLTIAPTVSYVLNEKMQVGISLSYTCGSTTTFYTIPYSRQYEAWDLDKYSMFSVAPYFRYYFANAGNFNFFCEAKLGFYLTPKTHYHYYNSDPGVGYDNEGDGNMTSSAIDFFIVPGVNYKFNDHWSADCYIDLAGLYFSHNTTKTYAPDNALDNTDVNNYFGLYATSSAQDLNNHLRNFRIGFNYHF